MFCIEHRNEITDPKKLGTPKFFLLDEAWLFIKKRDDPLIMWCRRRKHGASTKQR